MMSVLCPSSVIATEREMPGVESSRVAAVRLKSCISFPGKPVCGELQFMRQWGSEIRRCSVAASDMTQLLRSNEEVRRCVELAWLRPTRCDTGVRCNRPCNSRASAQDRFGSKIGSGRDTRAAPSRSIAQRKHGNEEYRELL